MENESTSLDAAVTAAYEKAHAPEPPPAAPSSPAPEPASPAAPETPSEPAAAPPSDGRVRDEHGRFKAKDTAAPTEGGAETAGASAQPQAPTTVKPEPDKHLQAMGMTAGDAEMFKALPEAAQKFLTRRYREMETGLKDVLPLREFQPVAEMFKPYEAQLRMAGLTPSGVIQRWAAAEQMLQQNPVAALGRLAQMYGVDLAQIAPQASQQASQAPQQGGDSGPSWLAADPLMQRTQQELDWVKAQLAERETQHYAGQIDQFANMKGQDGKLAHPYFEKVRQRMGAMVGSLPQGAVPDLEALYQEACWGHPEIREELLAAQRDAAARAAQSAAQAKAAAAGKAGISLGSGAPLPGSDRPAPQSMDAVLNEAWNRAHR
jgi:hypothetical protein